MTAKIRIIAFTRYAELGSSSRLRFYQYLPYLQTVGFEIKVSPLLNNDYIDSIYANRWPVWSVLKGYIKRCYDMLLSTKYDIIWVEKECLPWFPSWFEKAFLKYKNSIVDYDDATFHQYDSHPNFIVRTLLGHKIDDVMAAANTIVAGNAYIKQRATQAGAKNITVLPTVIDLKKYGVCVYESNKKNSDWLDWFASNGKVFASDQTGVGYGGATSSSAICRYWSEA
jgi:hypothetical protein